MTKMKERRTSSLVSDQLEEEFLSYAASVLAGFHGSREWASQFSKLAIACDIKIPYPLGPAGNKQTLIFENLRAFEGKDQYAFIEGATYETHMMGKQEIKDLRQLLKEKYGARFAPREEQGISQLLVEETKHWLSPYPGALRLYTSAEEKYHAQRYQRNLLDDLRLALESLLREVLGNKKTLENQTSLLGTLLCEKGTSKEVRKMFHALIAYFCEYQNTYVKHHDAAPHEEVEFVFDLTSSFLKHIVRITK